MTTLEKWHQVLTTKSTSLLSELLDDNVVFYSPVVHTPQKGKAVTMMYLGAALHVFFNETFQYVKETKVDNHAVLEFKTTISGVEVNGVDMISWNDDGKIIEFKVMVRPLKAINIIHELMQGMLKKLAPSAN